MMTRMAKRLNPNLDLAGVFFTEHTERTILGQDVSDEVREAADGKVFNTFIRKTIALAECTTQGMDVFTYDQGMEQDSHGSIDYRNLTAELVGEKTDGKAYQRKKPASEGEVQNDGEVVGNVDLKNKFQAFLKTKNS